MQKLFIDFDNTITMGDVGDALFLQFGGKECIQYDEDYRAGRLSAKQCLLKKCLTCGAVDYNELNDFIDSRKIDAAFPGFVEFCKRHDLDITVVSDGLDYYILRILQRYNRETLAIFSNKVRLERVPGSENVRLVPSFPYDDEECTMCACCKRNVMLTYSGADDILVYIGDGYSDRCPVQYADIVFARAELQLYCQRQNISYYEFRSFRDIQKRLEWISQHKRVRKRHAAEANRQSLFMTG